jgi:kinesin family protein 5
LGGNAKTALLINCSPSSYNAMETLSTLRFGSRAKSITNKPKINEQRSVEELQVLLQKVCHFN